MNIVQAFILGIIQGLTEFIPVSSTAHLLIVENLFKIDPENATVFAFNVIIQFGTTLAVIVYFWQDLLELLKAFFAKPFSTSQNRLVWYIIIATIPALLAGALLKDSVAQLFRDPLLAASIRLFLATVLLVLAERFGRRNRELESMKWPDALVIGLMQIIAVFPGASRSTTTISGGMFRGLDRPAAARFAFLMSIPIMLAASGYEMVGLVKDGVDLASFLPVLAAGLVSAAIMGWLSIKWLLGYLHRNSLYVFAVYCAALGAVCLALRFIG